MKRLFLLLALFVLFSCFGPAASAYSPTGIELHAQTVLLVSMDTGTVLFEKNADERRQAASVTKLMTLLICFEELEAGNGEFANAAQETLAALRRMELPEGRD